MDGSNKKRLTKFLTILLLDKAFKNGPQNFLSVNFANFWKTLLQCKREPSNVYRTQIKENLIWNPSTTYIKEFRGHLKSIKIKRGLVLIPGVTTSTSCRISILIIIWTVKLILVLLTPYYCRLVCHLMKLQWKSFGS